MVDKIEDEMRKKNDTEKVRGFRDLWDYGI